MIDVHGLKVFTTVAEKLSFSRAAETLLMTQSAVSHQIAKMERTFGVLFLNRNGKSISLTPAGQTFLQHARSILRSMNDLESAVRTASAPDQGRLRIGASATACQYLLPDALREFRECFPRYALSITPADGDVVLKSLEEGAIDLGIMVIPDARPKSQFHPIFSDELGLVFNPLHPLARLDNIKPQDLRNHPLVQYSRSSTTFQMVERHWSKLKIPIVDPIELGSIEAIKELVKLGLGISVLAKWVVTPQLTDQSLIWRPLPGSRLIRRWVVATPVQHVPTLAEKTFIELLRQCCPNEAQPYTSPAFSHQLSETSTTESATPLG